MTEAAEFDLVDKITDAYSALRRARPLTFDAWQVATDAEDRRLLDQVINLVDAAQDAMSRVVLAHLRRWSADARSSSLREPLTTEGE